MLVLILNASLYKAPIKPTRTVLFKNDYRQTIGKRISQDNW